MLKNIYLIKIAVYFRASIKTVKLNILNYYRNMYNKTIHAELDTLGYFCGVASLFTKKIAPLRWRSDWVLHVTNKENVVSDGKTELKKKRNRRVVPYPLCSFEEVANFAASAYELGAGRSVRRVTLLDHIGRSPNSGATRALITNAGKYGLIKGSYNAGLLEITDLAKIAYGERSSDYAKAEAKIELGILTIEPFKILYEKFVGNKLPSRTVLADTLRENDIDEKIADSLVDIFVVNSEYVGILQILAGAERLVTVEHALKDLRRHRLKTQVKITFRFQQRLEN
jgi:hypothetical protein